jgi:predicted nuclease with TOPRIM domain
MTPEEVQAKLADHDRWFAEMQATLERTSELTERNSKIAESNVRAIEATNNQLDMKFNQIADAVIRAQDRLERLERRDKQFFLEIRGLRVETRCMLERWLGEPFTDDPDLDDEDEE